MRINLNASRTLTDLNPTWRLVTLTWLRPVDLKILTDLKSCAGLGLTGQWLIGLRLGLATWKLDFTSQAIWINFVWHELLQYYMRARLMTVFVLNQRIWRNCQYIDGNNCCFRHIKKLSFQHLPRHFRVVWYFRFQSVHMNACITVAPMPTDVYDTSL